MKFENEAYFSAIDLYKKGEVKEKNIKEKGRINYQLAECYRYSVEPAQAQTYYQRAIKLKYHEENQGIYLLLADVLKEQGEYQSALENITKFLELNPENKKASDALASCKKAIEWKENPTKHMIQNEILINSDHYDFAPTWGDNKHNVLILLLQEKVLQVMVSMQELEKVSWTCGQQQEIITANGANHNYCQIQ